MRKMKFLASAALTFLYLLLSSVSLLTSEAHHNGFLKCFFSLTNVQHSNYTSDKILLTKNTSSYLDVLQFSAQNLRFLTPTTPKPEFIIQPVHVSQIQAIVLCSKENNIQIRVRSGGHDYEGLSYVSNVPFLVIDLSNFRSVRVDVRNKMAWVDSGATLGELYHGISRKSLVHGFPAGTCPTVGVGGHLSGGGFGTILRKYGLAADNVIDVHLVDVRGKILDRKSMGDDLFWAIRGGGGASFGVVISWKVNLVPVPSKVTICQAQKTLEQDATRILYKWQTVADKFPEDLFLHATTSAIDSTKTATKTVIVSFTALFLGGIEGLLSMTNQSFPELGLIRGDCSEMSWIQSVLYFAGFSSGESPDVLLNRTKMYNYFFKIKSDYVQVPIPESGWKEIWRILQQNERGMLILTPYGGKMNKISESAIPFPHRRGNIFKIQYLVYWENGNETSQHVEWIRRLYSHMTPFVSKFPRAAYLNYRDLDLGQNKKGNSTTSYAEASVWGLKYFKNNFRRLARTKTQIDPTNFFRNEQSIPLLN